MTISSNNDPKAGPYNGNDSQTAFPFSFRAFLSTDLLVIRTDDEGVEYELTPGSDYSVSLNADQNANPGGTVTYPISGDPLPDGETLTIVSDLEYLQPLNLLNGGAFSPSVQNTAFDRVTMLVKQVKEKVSRALQLAVSTPVGVDVTLPVPEASKVIGWSADGTSLANFAADTSVSTDLFADRLADTSSASNGAGISAFNAALSYIAPSVGHTIKRRGISITDYPYLADPTGATDSTVEILAAEAARSAGQVLIWPAGTYTISGDITALSAGAWIMQPGCVINSTNGRLLFSGRSDFTCWAYGATINYTGTVVSGENRPVRTGGAYSAEYGVSGTIAVGATSFTADTAGEAATLSAGDWVIVINADVTNWIQVEFKQVASVAGATINVISEFGQDFDGSWPIIWHKVTTLSRNVRIYGLNINVVACADDAIGLDNQPCGFDLIVKDVTFDIVRGLAYSFYGQYNPTADNLLVKRQVGRRSGWSSTHGGTMKNCVHETRDTAPTNAHLTVETGVYLSSFINNKFLGAGSTAVLAYFNNIRGCKVSDNMAVGNGTGIGFQFSGVRDCDIADNAAFNVSEGVRIANDPVTTPDFVSQGNTISNLKVRNASIGVNVGSGAIKTVINGLDVDSTVTTPIQDVGTNTQGDAVVITWTPTLTFVTPGDLAVTYSLRTATITKMGGRCFVDVLIATSAFTHTTASGAVQITGMPFTPLRGGVPLACIMGGYTKANYTAVVGMTQSTSPLGVYVGGSGQALAVLTASDMPTGGTVTLRISGEFDVAL